MAAGVCLLLAMCGSAEAAKPAATLKPARLAVAKPTVAQGAAVAATVTLRGRGSARVTLLLSRDAKLDRRDVKVGTVRARAKHGKATAKLSAPIPAKTKPGKYRLLACVGKRCATHALGVVATAPTAKLPAGAINATATLGDGAVTQTVGRAGATLTTTARGITYTFTIPADALPEDTAITMTPIASIAGTPNDSRFTAGVVFAPEGLQFYKAATLAISGVAKPAEQMAFMAQGSGAGWHGTPLTADPAKLEIPMLHFTAAGTMSDADGSVSAAAAQHPPADPKDQVAQDVAAELEKARKGEQTPEEAFKKAVARLQRYYDEVLAPGMAAHKGYDDDATATAFISDLLAWSRAMQLAGGDGREATIFSYAATLVERSYQRHQAACKTQHDLNEVPLVLGRDRLLQLLGVSTHTIAEDTKCLGFKLHIDINYGAVGSNTNGTWHMVGDATLSSDDPLRQAFGGTGAMTWSQYDFTHTQSFPGCTETDTGTSTDPSTLTVSNLRAVAGADGKLDHFELTFDPGQPAEHVHIAGCGMDGDYNDSKWRDAFNAFHQLRGDVTTLSLPAVPPVRDGSAVLGRQVFNPAPITIPDPAGTFLMSETAVVEIVHNPA